MKTDIYNTLAGLNRGFDLTLESLNTLQEQGVLTPEYVQDQTPLIEELRAGLNHMILDKLEMREPEDWAQFGKTWNAVELRLKS